MDKEGITISTLMAGNSGTLIDEVNDVVVVDSSRAVTVELPDGTQAIVHSALGGEDQTENMDGVAIQLEDGRFGYIYGDTLLHEVSTDADHSDDPLLISNKFNSVKTSTGTNNSSNGKLVCEYPDCGKKYSNVGHLKIHQRTHTGTRQHECDVCKKTFITGYALKSHKRTHTGEKPYHCPDDACGKSFKTSGDLQKHVRTHTGERPFKCELCDKSFTTSNIRKVHMRVHTGEKPYECQYEGCDRKFASATNFRNHCRIHTGEKPYVCSIGNCGKRFTEYSSLYKHHMVHSQQKRYYCAQCGRFYRQQSTLAVHRKNAHNIVENEHGELIPVLVGQNLPLGFYADVKNEGQEGTNYTVAKNEAQEGTNDMLNTATTSSRTKTVNLRKMDILPGNILHSNFLNEEVEVTNVHLSGDTLIQDSQGSSLTSLEIEESGSGSIFVLTDPSQLAALQQLTVASASADNTGEDSVKVISLDDLTVAESTITGSFEYKKWEEDSNCNEENVIIVEDIEQSFKSEPC